jgi:hypothetical protein
MPLGDSYYVHVFMYNAAQLLWPPYKIIYNFSLQ